MIQFSEKLFAAMEEQLQQAAITEEPYLHKAERSYHIIQSAIAELKNFITDYTFKSPEEEVRFFKEIKPMFQSRLIYWAEMIQIESDKPPGPKKFLRNYYILSITLLRTFLERNRSLYKYYKLQRSNNDHLLFLNGNNTCVLIHEYDLDLDHSFTRINSVKLSKIIAYESLIEHLQLLIHKLENPAITKDHAEPMTTGLSWTDSKSAIIELIYAIHARGAVNGGKVELKQLVRVFEHIFNIRVGNFYRIFTDFTIRKKNRTPFLDALKENFNKKLDENLY